MKIDIISKQGEVKGMLETDTSIKLNYLQWNDMGYQVQKGEKSNSKNEKNQALFSITQTKKINEKIKTIFIKPYIKRDKTFIAIKKDDSISIYEAKYIDENNNIDSIFFSDATFGFRLAIKKLYDNS